MISCKKVQITVTKKLGYMPISIIEKIRISRIIFHELTELAEMFDSDSTIEIRMKAKGNT